MEKLVHKLKQDHPDLIFSIGTSHCWSPEGRQISYATEDATYNIEGLLHELGHARLKHHTYTSDFELLQKELEAWQEALKLAKKYGVSVDQDHMQDCLDTYRDWVHKRSICPNCIGTGIQENEKQYICLNCGHVWQVSASRFCRPYRLSKTGIKN